MLFQIWGNRPLHRGGPDDREGYWGEVMYTDDVMMCVYLGTTPEQIIARMQTVLSLCFYDV